MKNKFVLLTIVTTVTAGCSSISTVSSSDTNQLIAAIESLGASEPPKVVQWVQPQNKKVACKIYQADWPNTQARFIWDGDCKDGYAYGLGREFADGGGISGSWVGEYHGGQNKPTYYSMSNYTTQTFAYGTPEEGASVIAKSSNMAVGEDYIQTLGKKTDKASFSRQFSTVSGETAVSVVFPNGYSLGMSIYSDPADSRVSSSGVKKGTQFVGFGIIRYRNGAAQQIKFAPQGPVPVHLPDSYLTFLNDQSAELNRNLDDANRNAEQSSSKVLEYRQRLCARPKSSDEPAHYRDICQEQGDLTEVNTRIAALSKDRMARFERSAESQRQLTLQAAQIQAMNNQTQAINNQTQAINNQAFINSSNDANNAMQQNTRTILQNVTANTVIPNFGARPTYQTTCNSFGSVTRCNTQ